MPIREFYCPACESVFEELLRSADKTEQVACPSCGNKEVSQKMSVFAARAGGGRPAAVREAGGCGRCGDPDGPCGL
jgi:putative FmdB family regulatory protein